MGIYVVFLQNIKKISYTALMVIEPMKRKSTYSRIDEKEQVQKCRYPMGYG